MGVKFFAFIILIAVAGGATFLDHQDFHKKGFQVDQLFSEKKMQKMEAYIRVKSEVSTASFKTTFLAADLGGGLGYKVTVGGEQEVKYSDCLHVRGTISKPESSGRGESETLYNFPYAEYLAKDDVYLLYKVSRLESLASCEPLSRYEKVKSFFLTQKQKITNIFLEKYEQPYAGLVAGVLIAGKGLMSPETLDIFKKVSLSHVIVLSGSNVSIIIFCIKYVFDLLFGIFRIKENLVSEIIKKILMILLITSFVLLTGGGAPIYRAFISSFCALVIFRKNTSQVYALTVVVLIMTIINPFGSLYDPSFHLTCCATYGLILFSKYFDQLLLFSKFNFLPKSIREIVSVTLATQVFVFPYIIFMSGSFSTVFLLSNVVVLPLIPLIMLLGFLSLFPWLSGVCVAVNNVILHLVFYLVTLLGRIPHAYILFSKKTSIFILIFYGLFVLFLFSKIKTSPPQP